MALYLCCCLLLTVCIMFLFILDGHVAILWLSNCPYGLPLFRFPFTVWSLYVCVSFPLVSLMGGAS